MPDINIFVESSFFASASGTEDAYVEFFTKAADNIGLRDTPAVTQFQPSVSGTGSVTTEVSVSELDATVSGFSSTAVTYEAETTTMSGVLVALVDYATPETASGTQTEIDNELVYFTGWTKISGSSDSKIYFTAGDLYASYDDLSHSYWRWPSTSATNDYITNYTAGGEYDPLIPGPPADQFVVSGTFDARTYFTSAWDLESPGFGSGTQQVYQDLTLAGYPMEFHPDKYTYRFDLITGIEGDTQGPKWEATVISGAVLDMPFDLYSGTTTSGYYKYDAVCGLVDLVSYSFDSETISGTINHYYYDMICGVSGTQSYGFDVDLFPLKISNFSLDIDGFTHAAGIVCVDITDDVYNVVSSGTYFIIDGTVTSGTFTSITDGYTMCYDPADDFASFKGSTTFTVHAENDNSDVLERNFYLTSGYLVEYDNRDQDYGYSSQVVVRATAENLASCPTTGTDAYYFTTTPKPPKDLGASIVGIPWSEKDLSASIIPTTDTIYFYGKVFRIEVRAKDFAGNVMEPFTFEFKIEDKPE